MKARLARIGHLGLWLLIAATFPVAFWFLIVAGLRNALTDDTVAMTDQTRVTT